MKAAPPGPNGTPTGQRAPRYPQVALGKGSIDWVRTFTAARTCGVRNYFVEQTWELTQQSVAYLKNLNV